MGVPLSRQCYLFIALTGLLPDSVHTADPGSLESRHALDGSGLYSF